MWLGDQLSYFADRSSAPSPALTATDEAGTAFFYNVDPGPHVLRLVAEDPSRTLRCSADPLGRGATGAPGFDEQQNQITVVVRPGVNSFSGTVFCSLE